MITQEDELIFVWRVSWPMTGEQCYFGVESAANAYARSTGQVEKFGIPRRDFKAVPTEVSDAEHRKYVELWDHTHGTPCEQILHHQLQMELHDANSALKESVHILNQARDYILHKARRHDLNWQEGNHIIDKIDYFFELGTVHDIQAT